MRKKIQKPQQVKKQPKRIQTKNLPQINQINLKNLPQNVQNVKFLVIVIPIKLDLIFFIEIFEFNSIIKKYQSIILSSNNL